MAIGRFDQHGFHIASLARTLRAICSTSGAYYGLDRRYLEPFQPKISTVNPLNCLFWTVYRQSCTAYLLVGGAPMLSPKSEGPRRWWNTDEALTQATEVPMAQATVDVRRSDLSVEHLAGQ